MNEIFSGDLGIMISGLLVFTGITDMMVLILFFGKNAPSNRATDTFDYMTEEQKKMVKQRLFRYQVTQFSIAMSGLFMIVAGLYGISTMLVK